MLAAVFSEKGMLKGDHLELSKADFVGLLKDAGLLIIPKPVKGEEKKGPDGKAPAEDYSPPPLIIMPSRVL